MESDPQLIASKERGTSILQPQGTEFCQEPVSLEKNPEFKIDHSPS